MTASRTILAVAVVMLAATACTPTHQAPASASPAGDKRVNVAPATQPANAAKPAPGTCKLGNRNGQPLPDPACTPGVVNPAVTQANLGDTVCKSGWTATVRPSTSVTTRIKRDVAVAYGLPAETQGELDHLISLELGGAPSDVRNLWVEPGKIPNPKDAVEGKMKSAVCSGLIPLATAQTAIAGDWTTAFDAAGLRVAGGKVCLRSDPSGCATGHSNGGGVR